MVPPLTQRIIDGWVDPIRRRNSISRIVEGLIGCLVTLMGFVFLPFPWVILSPGLGVLAEFIVYEFVLEPCGFSGHYWERGPRSGEEFRRP